MSTNKITTNILAALGTTAVIAVLIASASVAVLDILGLLDSTSQIAVRLPAITLLVLTGISLHLVIDRITEAREFQNIRVKLENIANNIESATQGVEIKLLNGTDEGFGYLCERYRLAEKTIRQAAIAPSTDISPALSEEYENTIKAVQSKGIVRYTYVAVLDPIRADRVNRLLSNGKPGKYVVKKYSDYGQIPGVSFSIVDGKEVIARVPYNDGDREPMWLSIKHPQIVLLFENYFDKINNGAKPL